MAAEKGKKKLESGRHVSAIKRHRQSLKRRALNQHFESTMKSAVKKVRKAVADNKSAEAAALLKEAVSTINKTAQKGIIPKPRASRMTSRLTVAVSKVS